MYFKQILDERCGCASYVIVSCRSHEAVIVDSSIYTEQYGRRYGSGISGCAM